MSWSSARGLIVHPNQIDPVLAADEVRADGFGWIRAGTIAHPSSP